MSADRHSRSGRALHTLLYDPNLPPHQLADAYFTWGRAFPAAPPFTLPRRGRLRIGYLSGNFCTNPEVLFTLPILRHHDRRRVEVFCYSNVAQPDAYTAQFQSLADHWRDIAALSDPDAAQLIRRDRIEILIDLSGHWVTGRVALLAHRPAPVQISFPTYPATSGLAAVDYRITDTWSDPPGLTEHLHSETLVRLHRCYCCYEIPQPLPPLSRLPALRRGFITFGSFHRAQKLNSELLRLWSAVLQRVPRSRLLFHHVFGTGSRVESGFKQAIAEALQSQGIAPSRVSFVGRRKHFAHLATLARADIALDAYPYHGMTITCDSLAMGVPVLTLAGRSHVSRTGVSLLTAVELADWIAATPEEYIEIAVAQAADLAALSRLRRSLRGRLRRSPLTDGPGYVRALESTYRRCLRLSKRESP